jgi:predicted kinase
MPRLTLIRGLPGSGKTTLAENLQRNNPACRIVAADDFFGKEYKWHKRWVKYAHSWCLGQTARLMYEGFDYILVHNTFVRIREIVPYRDLANEMGYEFQVIEPDTGWSKDPEACWQECTHNVPLEVIQRMHREWELWNA